MAIGIRQNRIQSSVTIAAGRGAFLEHDILERSPESITNGLTRKINPLPIAAIDGRRGIDGAR
jgi:hypothetical protein